MSEVLRVSGDVAQVVTQISDACREQATGVQQVSEAVQHMDQTTQRNAALVEESAAASEALRRQADLLLGLVARFQLRTA